MTIAISGQSNSTGFGVDADWDGEPLQAGVEIEDYNPNLLTWVTLTHYPDGSEEPEPKFCGAMPYIAQYYLARGATTVRIIRLGVNGSNINYHRSQVNTIAARANAIGWVPDYWVLIGGEAETVDPVASPAAEYDTRLEAYVRHVMTLYPNCRPIVSTLGMHTDDYGAPGSSDDWELVEANQRSVPPLYPDRVLLSDSRSPTQITLSGDQIHYSGGIGGGHDEIAERIVALAGG